MPQRGRRTRSGSSCALQPSGRPHANCSILRSPDEAVARTRRATASDPVGLGRAAPAHVRMLPQVAVRAAPMYQLDRHTKTKGRRPWRREVVANRWGESAGARRHRGSCATLGGRPRVAGPAVSVPGGWAKIRQTVTLLYPASLLGYLTATPIPAPPPWRTGAAPATRARSRNSAPSS